MDRIELLVSRTVDSYRRTFAIATVISVLGCIFQENWIGLLALGPILVVGYFVGLRISGIILARGLTPAVRQHLLQEMKIKALHLKMENEDVQPSEELDKLFIEAGLEPLGVIVEWGPVIGKHGNDELYEWIDSKKGMTGEVLRYTYTGNTTTYESDGTVQCPAGDFISYEGRMYEHVR